MARDLVTTNINTDVYACTWSLTEEDRVAVEQGTRAGYGHGLTWLTDKEDGYGDVLAAKLGKPELGEKAGPS